MDIAKIIVNDEVYNYDNNIVLSDEDVDLINEELRKPEVIASINQIDKSKMILNIKYIELHTEWIKESVNNFDDEFGEDKELKIIASDRLKDYLLNRLLYIREIQ